MAISGNTNYTMGKVGLNALTADALKMLKDKFKQKRGELIESIVHNTLDKELNSFEKGQAFALEEVILEISEILEVRKEK